MDGFAVSLVDKRNFQMRSKTAEVCLLTVRRSSKVRTAILRYERGFQEEVVAADEIAVHTQALVRLAGSAARQACRCKRKLEPVVT